MPNTHMRSQMADRGYVHDSDEDEEEVTYDDVRVGERPDDGEKETRRLQGRHAAASNGAAEGVTKGAFQPLFFPPRRRTSLPPSYNINDTNDPENLTGRGYARLRTNAIGKNRSNVNNNNNNNVSRSSAT